MDKMDKIQLPCKKHHSLPDFFCSTPFLIRQYEGNPIGKNFPHLFFSSYLANVSQDLLPRSRLINPLIKGASIIISASGGSNLNNISSAVWSRPDYWLAVNIFFGNYEANSEIIETHIEMYGRSLIDHQIMYPYYFNCGVFFALSAQFKKEETDFMAYLRKSSYYFLSVQKSSQCYVISRYNATLLERIYFNPKPGEILKFKDSIQMQEQGVPGWVFFKNLYPKKYYPAQHRYFKILFTEAAKEISPKGLDIFPNPHNPHTLIELMILMIAKIYVQSIVEIYCQDFTKPGYEVQESIHALKAYLDCAEYSGQCFEKRLLLQAIHIEPYLGLISFIFQLESQDEEAYESFVKLVDANKLISDSIKIKLATPQPYLFDEELKNSELLEHLKFVMDLQIFLDKIKEHVDSLKNPSKIIVFSQEISTTPQSDKPKRPLPQQQSKGLLQCVT